VSNGHQTTKFAYPITTGMSFNRTLWQLTGRQIGHEARALMNARLPACARTNTRARARTHTHTHTRTQVTIGARRKLLAAIKRLQTPAAS